MIWRIWLESLLVGSVRRTSARPSQVFFCFFWDVHFTSAEWWDFSTLIQIPMEISNYICVTNFSLSCLDLYASVCSHCYWLLAYESLYINHMNDYASMAAYCAIIFFFGHEKESLNLTVCTWALKLETCWCWFYPDVGALGFILWVQIEINVIISDKDFEKLPLLLLMHQFHCLLVIVVMCFEFWIFGGWIVCYMRSNNCRNWLLFHANFSQCRLSELYWL